MKAEEREAVKPAEPRPSGSGFFRGIADRFLMGAALSELLTHTLIETPASEVLS